jgi:hypothetical protein
VKPSCLAACVSPVVRETDGALPASGRLVRTRECLPDGSSISSSLTLHRFSPSWLRHCGRRDDATTPASSGSPESRSGNRTCRRRGGEGTYRNADCEMGCATGIGSERSALKGPGCASHKRPVVRPFGTVAQPGAPVLAARLPESGAFPAPLAVATPPPGADPGVPGQAG